MALSSRQVKRIAHVILAAVLLIPLALVNVRAHFPGDRHTVRAQLRFLEDALTDNAADRMQQLFPEGFVFTWAVYGLSCAQTARQLDGEWSERSHLLHEAARAVDVIRSARARAPFDPAMNPKYGAFYASWSLYVLAEYARAVGPANMSHRLESTLVADADAFATALREGPSPYLASYPSQAWPADAAVGVAALGICDQILAPRYAGTIADWVGRVRLRLDPDLHAISHAAHPADGSPRGGVRGSSLALMSRVLVDADPDFAREQYVILRDHFVDRRLGFPGVREYPLGANGEGDVDSGPLLLGFSGPAVVVGAAAAQVHGDGTLARALCGVVEVVGVPIGWWGTRRYGGGLVPIGDAFIAWARSSPRDSSTPMTDWPPKVPARWMIPLHLVSALLAGLVLLRLWIAWKRA